MFVYLHPYGIYNVLNWLQATEAILSHEDADKYFDIWYQNVKHYPSRH